MADEKKVDHISREAPKLAVRIRPLIEEMARELGSDDVMLMPALCFVIADLTRAHSGTFERFDEGANIMRSLLDDALKIMRESCTEETVQ